MDRPPWWISSVGGTSQVGYIYTADGNKVASNVNGSITHYAGAMIYNSNTGVNLPALSYIKHQEGVVTAAGDRFEYRYFLRDHIGSTRVVLNASKSGSAWTLRPIQVTEYYPFGLPWETNNLQVNKYLFSGKEYQDAAVGSRGLLGLYDFHARLYNPLYGRWFNQDPAMQTTNPYLYCYNSPGMYIDPDGRFIGLIVGGFIKGVMSYSAGTRRTGGWNWRDALINGGIGMATGGLAMGIDGWIGSGQGVQQQIGPGYVTTSIPIGGQYGSFSMGYVQGMNKDAYLLAKHVQTSHGYLNYKENNVVDLSLNQNALLQYGIISYGVLVSGLSYQVGTAGAPFRTFIQNSNAYGWGLDYTKEIIKVNTASSVLKSAANIGYLVGLGMTINDFKNADTFENKLVSGVDVFMAGLGRVPIVGSPLAVFWGGVGRYLHWNYVNEVIAPDVRSATQEGRYLNGYVYMPVK